MWIVLALFGLAVIGLGAWLIRLGAFDSPTRFSQGDNVVIETPVPGVAVLLVGIIIVVFAIVVVRGPDAPDRPKITKPTSVSAAAAGGGSRAPAQALPTTTAPPTATAPSSTPSLSTTPAEQPPASDDTSMPACTDDDPEPGSTGPWDDCQNEVHVIVARVVHTSAEGRVRIYLRVENDSDSHVGIPDDAFLAVDGSGHQYQADEDHSDWDFESFGDRDLPPGRRLAGYIGLDGSVPAGETELRVDLNLSLRSEDYSDDDQFFIVHVPTVIGS